MINEKQYSLVAEPIDTKQLKKTFASISGLTRVAVLKNDNLDYRQSPCCVRSNIFCPFHYIDLRLRVKNKTIGSKICSVSYQDCPESEILSENEPKVFHEDMDEYLLYLDDILMKEAYVTHRLYIKFDCEQTVKELAPGDVYIEWFPGEVSHESTDRFIELFYPQSKESARKHISQFDLRYALLMLPTCTKYTNGQLSGLSRPRSRIAQGGTPSGHPGGALRQDQEGGGGGGSGEAGGKCALETDCAHGSRGVDAPAGVA